jgi:hypothetical protein
LRDEVRARLFSETPLSLEGDLFGDFLGNWHVLGPYGPMTESSPLFRRDPAAPEGQLASTYPSTFGTALTWRELHRSRNDSTVQPTDVVHPATGGVSYLLTFVKAPTDEALLEIRDPSAFQVYWNGALMLECLRGTTTEQEYRFLAPVRLNDGWNALLIRFPTRDRPHIAARLLDSEGRRLEVDEAQWDGRDLPVWSESAPASIALPARTADAPFEDVLDMLIATTLRRADQALAVAEPEDSVEFPAWLRARHGALVSNHHLPTEVRRRRQIAVEERLAEIGANYPAIDLHRANRLIAEDKPEEALEIADTLLAACPDVAVFRWLHVRALLALDTTGALAQPHILEMLERFDGHAAALAQLVETSAENDDWTGAVDASRRLLRARGTGVKAPENVFAWLAMDRSEVAVEAGEWIERWRREFPGDERIDGCLRKLLLARGDLAALRANLEEKVRERPYQVGALLDLANSRALDGEEGEVVSLLQQVIAREPGRHDVHRTLDLLGVPDEAEEFFREFAPDVEAARAATVSATDASTALVLDSGMVYLRPDSAAHYRTHSIELALDRTGTERLHEDAAHDNNRIARVLDADGTVFEPVLVDGTWVWPSLDPGDAVEQVYDRFFPVRLGASPLTGEWFFASFDQPFVYSRYVVFVPDGLPGEWRQARFDGDHEEIPWHGGVVHVFSAGDQPRFKEEPSRPSNGELLPWVGYGADLPLDEIAADYRRHLRYLKDLAADVRVELELIVDGIEGSDQERAAALFEVVTDRVLEFTAEGDTTDVWTMRRGNPIGLLAALFELAGVEHDWAILAPPIAPELDPNPAPPFTNHQRFGLPCLRLADGSGDDPVWVVIPSGGRGLRFGSIPEQFAGARALVFSDEGAEYTELPRGGLDSSWSSDLDIVYRLDPDGVATVHGVVRITGTQGSRLREMVSRVEPQQRSQIARSLASQAVKGLDLAEWEFADLEERGAPLELTFEGLLPGFLEGDASAQTCRLRLPPYKQSTSVGPAIREWALALRSDSRNRVRIRLECGEAWSYEYAPESRVETRDGYRYEFKVTREENSLEVLRIIKLRGLFLEPAEVPDFLTRCKECEDTEEREVGLTRR